MNDNINYYLSYYDKWSKYESENDDILIIYTSIYGNTKKAVLKLVEDLKQRGNKVALYDLARCDISAAVASAFRYSKLILATTTYNMDIFPHMRDFIHHLVERNYQKDKNNIIGIIVIEKRRPNICRSYIPFCENN